MTYTIVNNSAVLFFNNKMHTVDGNHPHFDEITKLLKDSTHNDQRIIELVQPVKIIENIGNGFGVDENENLMFKDLVIHNLFAKKVIKLYRENLPYTNLIKFLEKIHAVGTSYSIDQLYNFLERYHFPITEDGNFICYKGVKGDFTSVHSGAGMVYYPGMALPVFFENSYLPNLIGTTVAVERESVDTNPDKHCSHGLHCGAAEYARGFAPTLLLVEVNPADVVSVPNDYNFQKIRVCKYKVVAEHLDAEEIEDEYYSGQGRLGGDAHVIKVYKFIENSLDMLSKKYSRKSRVDSLTLNTLKQFAVVHDIDLVHDLGKLQTQTTVYRYQIDKVLNDYL